MIFLVHLKHSEKVNEDVYCAEGEKAFDASAPKIILQCFFPPADVGYRAATEGEEDYGERGW